MLTLYEIAERTQTGEKVEEKKWDMDFFKTISELVAKYGISYPGGDLYINMDDDLVERAFQCSFGSKQAEAPGADGRLLHHHTQAGAPEQRRDPHRDTRSPQRGAHG